MGRKKKSIVEHRNTQLTTGPSFFQVGFSHNDKQIGTTLGKERGNSKEMSTFRGPLEVNTAFLTDSV